jgi:arabinofuranosyltransferase
MKNFLKQNLAIICLLLVFAVVVAKTAWLSDDAYITLRTIRNFVAAQSLTYNLGERVQAYTHPLWMFVLLLFYFFTREAYHTPIIISMVISLIAVTLIATKVATSQAAAILGLVVLILSKAFVDYSTSGLENPLTHLILVGFCALYLRGDSKLQTMFLLSFLSGLAMLNRMDTVLLFAPALMMAVFQPEPAPSKGSKVKKLGAVALGFLPVLVWLGFATVYYGFPFPNTAYAKLNTGIAPGDLVRQGLTYLSNSLRMDPLTLGVIGAGLLVAVFKRTSRQLSIALGMLTYVIYTVWIGGDFMSGRFLTAPLVGAVSLMGASGYVTNRATLFPPLSLALLIGLASTRSPIYSGSEAGLDLQISDLIDKNGINDERLFYYRATGWLTANGVRPSPDLSNWAKKASEYSGQPVVLQCASGIYGYFIAPQAHIVDYCAALVDPLLARLPAAHRKAWRIGHFERRIPDGYLETLATGSNKISDTALAQFYDKLILITRGELFTTKRLIAIWKMNTGQYNSLLGTASHILSGP